MTGLQTYTGACLERGNKPDFNTGCSCSERMMFRHAAHFEIRARFESFLLYLCLRLPANGTNIDHTGNRTRWFDLLWTQALIHFNILTIFWPHTRDAAFGFPWPAHSWTFPWLWHTPSGNTHRIFYFYTWNASYSVVNGTVIVYLAGQGCWLHFSTVLGAVSGGHSESGTFTTSALCFWTHLTGRILSPPPQEALQGPNVPASHLQNSELFMGSHLCWAACPRQSTRSGGQSVKLTWGDRGRADRLCGVVWVEEVFHSCAPPNGCWFLHLHRCIRASVHLMVKERLECVERKMNLFN